MILKIQSYDIVGKVLNMGRHKEIWMKQLSWNIYRLCNSYFMQVVIETTEDAVFILLSESTLCNH